jgi:hypothetical protein
MAERTHETIESGAPDPMPYMHPVMKDNYGKWVFHSHPKPGVLYHRAENGDEDLDRQGWYPAPDGPLHHSQTGRHCRPVR